jgi:hypothetical protein
MRTLFNRTDVDKSDLVKYPSGRIKDNSGVGDGTGVNEATKGDFHQMLEKLMRLYAIIPNDLPDNETNGFQLIDALRGLASKNDFIYPLSTNGTILNVDIKFSQMLDNEYIVCLAAFDKASETQIKGIGAGTFAITYSGNFKTNEYVRVIKTSGGVSIIRIADALSLDAMVTELLFLKKASQAEEDAGAIDTKATTPLTNLTAFVKRVIGSDSGSYLANASRNGLYSIAHYNIVAGLGASPVKNVGWFSGYNVASAFASLPVSGNITFASAIVSGSSDGIVTVTLQNAMTNTNYYVRAYVQSEGANIYDDNDICCPVFKPISTTQFTIAFREVSNLIQVLKVHLEVVQL